MLTMEIKAAFVDLTTQLSPENLHSDGEASAETVAARRLAIKRAWAELEERAGRKVSESEVGRWFQEVERWESEQEAIAMSRQAEEFGSHPLLHHYRVDVWGRLNERGKFPAYFVRREPTGCEDDAPWKFRVQSDWSLRIDGRNAQQILCDTLHEAVEAGEALLARVSRESMARAWPEWSQERLLSLLAQLPEPHRSRQMDAGRESESDLEP